MNSVSERSTIKNLSVKALWLMAIIFGVLLLVGTGHLLINSVSGEGLKRFNDGLDQLSFYIQFIRWFIYLLAFLFWEKLMQVISNIFNWPDEMRSNALAGRNMTIIIVLMVEVFIIQAVPSFFL